MIDYAKIKPGDRLRITGAGAPGFAQLGDEVEVLNCSAEKRGRCLVRHCATGATAVFELPCGAQRLEPASAAKSA